MDRVPALLQTTIQRHLAANTGAKGSMQMLPIGGGSINQTYQLTIGEQRFFCKINSASNFPQLFQKEADGLSLLRQQSGMYTPKVCAYFEAADHQVLALEWIDAGERTPAFWESFGMQLAAMHQVAASHWGLHQNNYMGNVPQNNEASVNWPSFFMQRRLEPMVKLCSQQQLLSAALEAQFEKLYRRLPQVFGDGQTPVLLHGDLWAGNFMCSNKAVPVLIDPAVYYGHPAVDLGMSRLFGGFDARFYQAYQYYLPLPPNYAEQWAVANLYPLLIHVYLFGGSYCAQVAETLKKFG